MTDGTTGIQVAPITEDEMSKVRSILERAANAIVGMSQLNADVEMLRQTVQGLQSDVERLRNQNAALDEALTHSRSIRDAQATELAQVRADLTKAIQERDDYKTQAEVYRDDREKVTAELVQTKKDRDDHGFRVMELEDELAKAKAKLDKIAEIFGSLPKAVQPAEPPPVLMPTWQPEPEAEAKPPESPYPSTQDMTLPAAPTRTYHGLTWAPGYLWDDTRGQYYTEA